MRTKAFSACFLVALFATNVPNALSQYLPVTAARGSQTEQSRHETFDRIIGACLIVRNPATLPDNPTKVLATNDIGPGALAVEYFRIVEKRAVPYSAQASILVSPKHGQSKAAADGGFVYLPDPGYLGSDSAAFKVDLPGMTVKVVEFIHVQREVTDEDYSEVCPQAEWRISGLSSNSSAISALANLEPNYAIRRFAVNL